MRKASAIVALASLFLAVAVFKSYTATDTEVSSTQSGISISDLHPDMNNLPVQEAPLP